MSSSSSGLCSSSSSSSGLSGATVGSGRIVLSTCSRTLFSTGLTSRGANQSTTSCLFPEWSAQLFEGGLVSAFGFEPHLLGLTEKSS
ncbi:hypothetical protein CesoFtcFv8_002679 [Champsocephalus esox]|uniref:Uncharacterized protein n=1 Tax=Champsocephalus esox TaxID=159716 RepID=A0AAN8HEZ8_9TELE|nr:hypothetical protein CesoFtcFv8_002679 [Champsocephalus esox]